MSERGVTIMFFQDNVVIIIFLLLDNVVICGRSI